MRLQTVCLLVLIGGCCVTLVWGATPGREVQRSEKSPFEGDARLLKPLTLEKPAVSLVELLAELHRQTAVELMVQGELLRRPLSLHVRERPARTLLEDLAVMFGGEWIKRGGAYLLLTDEAAARLCGRPPTMPPSRRDLVRSLVPAQHQSLERGIRLPVTQLLPAQQRLARAILVDVYLRNPQRHPSSVIRGEGVFLMLLPSDNGPPSFILSGPEIMDDGRVLENMSLFLMP